MPGRYVTEKRCEPRMMCSELVRVEWRDQSGRKRRILGNLEDISASGACVHLDSGVLKGTAVRIVAPRKVLKGRATWCRQRDMGYYLGLRFEPGVRWSRKDYAPGHLLDPRVLAARGIAQGGSRIAGL